MSGESVTADLGHRKARPFELFMPWTELMLMAFGIECLIKAVWVKGRHQLARNGKYISMIQNERHQLVKLCGVAGIPLDARETDALERITDIADTIGRYPIPRRASQIPKGCKWSSVDSRIVENLIVRLELELRKNTSGPQASPQMD